MIASIIINNYNYGGFLKEAIDSALNQTYPNTEVIVVDDGSTDNSKDIIATYENRVIPVNKKNGGQGSTFNAGFEVSNGKVIYFLDSDDILLPTAVERSIPFFNNPEVVKVHWPLWIVDKGGKKTGDIKPTKALPEGDFSDVILKGGPTSCISSPTSGNAWDRRFLEKVFPVPEDVDYYKICADEYLYTLAPVFGKLKKISEPQGFYRLHGKNIYSGKSFSEKLQFELKGREQQCSVLSKILTKFGFSIELELWKKNSWFHRLDHAVKEISSIVPEGDTFILIDDDTWGAQEIFSDIHAIPFIEKEGYYIGPPDDDETAILELERLRIIGADFLIFGWSSFWWLEEFQIFKEYLRTKFKCVHEDDDIIVFDIHLRSFKKTRNQNRDLSNR
ncbi:MAG: glycosyltransferase [Thermodesulfobacteriota bacterium]